MGRADASRSRIPEEHYGKAKVPQEHVDVDERKKKPPIRQILTRIVNSEDRSKIGTAVLILSTLNVFFALFGSDFQLAFCPKSADTAFQIGFLISFTLFFTEMVVTSIVDPKYKWSFFFWLDAVATGSLLLDIPWILDPLYAFVAGTTSNPLAAVADGSAAKAGKAGKMGARAGRVTRILRINRMIRVVKMSDIFTFYHKRRRERQEAENADEDAEVPAETTAVRKADKVEASKLSKTLSDSNTRKVVVSILLILTVQPLLTVEEVDRTPFAGLAPLFYFGTSRASGPCTPSNDEFVCSKMNISGNDPEDGWLTPEGWQEMLWAYQESYTGVYLNGNFFPKRLLSIDIPDLEKGGKLRMMKKISSSSGSRTFTLPSEWEQDNDCITADGLTKRTCTYRENEIESFAFTPEECQNGDDTSCSLISAQAVFENRTGKRLEAIQQMLVTLLIVILLCLGSFLFSSFTHSMVIQPVEKMVNIIKQLAKEPLSRPQITEEGDNADTKKDNRNKLETRMLENTLLKIGGLMQLGFGEAGAEIISRNISSESGTLDLLVPGKKVYGVFGFANIRHFQEITDCLSEEVLVFVNKIARIVHCCVNEWGGVPNKNIGDTFFLVWLVPSSPPDHANEPASPRHTLLPAAHERETEQVQKQLRELCDKALFASLKMMAEFRRASDLAAYAKHPKIIPRFGAGYSVNVSVGLHCGWAVQGVSGSKYKVDASYFSPHVNLAAHVQRGARYYGVNVLFTETVYSNLCAQAQSRARQVDNVSLKAPLSPVKVFTFDIGKEEVQPRMHDRQKFGKFIPPDDALDQKGNIDYMFLVDQDIVSLQRSVSVEFQAAWRQALENYQRGDWTRAEDFARKCLMMMPEDGPAIHMLGYIKDHKGIPPDDWQGFTKLDIARGVV